LDQRPCPRGIIGVEDGCQSLKVPAMETTEAFGSKKVKSTGRDGWGCASLEEGFWTWDFFFMGITA